MKYDKIIEVNLEECEIISRVVEVDEINDPSVLNIWMLYDGAKINKIPMTYLIYHFEKIKYTSDVLYQGLDLIRLKLLRKRTTNI